MFTPTPMLIRRQRRRTTTLEAICMHECVTPDRWCVTKADLRYLRRQVTEAIQEGQLPSSCMANDSLASSDSEESEESADERKFGPSIYEVTEKYIKPVTADAGKMSWALMQNPEGLDCHLFVSHAWQEGIFEFLSKVLTSWPSGAHNAWCCMLANPQHLNIGSMLQSPKTSPFALALQASRYVLVVPNRHQSVYCRLWCGYEAYVASENEKIIQIAAAPCWISKSWAFIRAMVPILLGVFIGLLAPSPSWHIKATVALMGALATLISAYTANRWRLLANHVGLVASTYLESLGEPFGLTGASPVMWQQAMHRVTWASAISYFLMAELDRVHSLQIEQEGRQLRRRYKGSIQFATCSQQTDQNHIWDEIGGKVSDVDTAIHVLISAGVSSPSLRMAAKRGVKIEGAGHAEVAVAFVVLGPLLFLCSVQLVGLLRSFEDEAPAFSAFRYFTISMASIGLLVRVAFVIMLCLNPVDEKMFLLKVITKLVAAIFVPLALIVGIFAQSWGFHAIEVVFMCSHFTLVVAFFFSLLGIKGTLALPGGRCMLQYVLARQGTCRICQTHVRGGL
ncbi:unnamed protein product [Durusdinium trenchii]|uniref:Uncharacterized protein n=1 Tax=Durusdinium trenchii TaxID=1381693 RepID=A0ABP0PXA1_9DINO